MSLDTLLQLFFFELGAETANKLHHLVTLFYGTWVALMMLGHGLFRYFGNFVLC
jgi:hypothetical protein